MTEIEIQKVEQINALYTEIGKLWARYHEARGAFNAVYELADQAVRDVLQARIKSVDKELLAATAKLSALARDLDPDAWRLQ